MIKKATSAELQEQHEQKEVITLTSRQINKLTIFLRIALKVLKEDGYRILDELNLSTDIQKHKVTEESKKFWEDEVESIITILEILDEY